MKVLNKLSPHVDFIAIETPKGEIVRLIDVKAEKLIHELIEAVYGDDVILDFKEEAR